MKLSEIRAAIKAKANSTNIEQPVPNAPEPIVKPKPETTPVKPQIIQSTTTRKKKSSTNNILNENSNPAQNITTPVKPIPAEQPIKQQKRESRTKISKSADNFVTEDIETIIGKYLRPNQDYAVIPHTTKPTLLKGGAEKLAAIFGFTTSCSIVNRIEHFDYENPSISFVQYEAKVMYIIVIVTLFLRVMVLAIPVKVNFSNNLSLIESTLYSRLVKNVHMLTQS